MTYDRTTLFSWNKSWSSLHSPLRPTRRIYIPNITVYSYFNHPPNEILMNISQELLALSDAVKSHENQELAVFYMPSSKEWIIYLVNDSECVMLGESEGVFTSDQATLEECINDIRAQLNLPALAVG